MTKKPQYPEHPFRVTMPDGTIHMIRRIGISQVAVEFADAARWEDLSKHQPPHVIEVDTDA